MKKSILISCVCVLLTTAASQGMIISFDENGNGIYTDGGGGPTPLLFAVNIPPAGIPGHSTLFYVLPVLPGEVVEGDVVLYEPDALGDPTSNISDILRFDIDAPPCVFVYSDLPEEGDLPPYALADTGIPDVWTGGAGGAVYFTEEGIEGGWNGLHYTPLPNQPGYMEGGVTYIFTSDIPEPATIALLGLGALSLIRRKNNKQNQQIIIRNKRK